MAEWQRSLTAEEFEDWIAFYERYPFDDFHRFQRPAALVAQAAAPYGGAEAMRGNLEWLAQASSSPADAMMAREDMNEYHRQFFAFAGKL